MKKTIILLLVLSAVFPALAQDTTYFNFAWKTTTRDKAHYYRTVVKNDSGWQVTDHYMSGVIQMKAGYADDSFHISQGQFSYYDEKGEIQHFETYVKGKAEGPHVIYYPDGHTRVIGNYKNDKEEGEWLGYYPNGKLSGKAQYENGKQVSGKFYNEDGSRNKSMMVFMRESEYPGGASHYQRFLYRTLKYPDSAVVHEIQGVVVIGFKISKEGKASDFTIGQSIDKYLDAEALRVAKLMPDWEPAIVGGVFSESYKRQPLVFRLE